MLWRCSLLVAVLCAAAATAEETGEARGGETPPADPAATVLQRNFQPDGKTPFDFAADRITTRRIAAVASGVTITFADGHDLTVPADGKVVLEVLRNGHDEVPAGSGIFRDAFSACFLVNASPEEVNYAIRDVAGYPTWFKNKKTYCHSWYSKGEVLDRSAFPLESKRLEANEQAVALLLTQQGFVVSAPESNLLQLALTVGVCNFLVKSNATPRILTTCYRVHGPSADGQAGPLLAIVNENSLAMPDEAGGARSQQVVWVIQPAPDGGGSTLVRYVYASELDKPSAAMVKDDRWDMATKNIEEFAAGIRDRALDVKKRGLVPVGK